MDTSKLIIEAYNLLNNGFDWMIRTEEDIKYLNENTEENNIILPVEELFFKLFSIEKKTVYTIEDVYNQGDLLNILLSKTQVKVTKYDIKEVIIKNKMVYTNHRDSLGNQKKGYKLYANSNIFESPTNTPGDDEIEF